MYGRVGDGQRVAVVDTGAAPFLFWNFLPNGQPWLIAEVDLRDASSCLHAVRSALFGSSLGLNSSRLHLPPRCKNSDYQNHVAKTTTMAYWSPMSKKAGADEDRLYEDKKYSSSGGGSIAPGVGIVSLIFADNLCVKVKNVSRELRPRGAYIAGLVRSLRWVLAQHRTLRISAVQISAYDGLYEDGPATWRRLEPEAYHDFAVAAERLLAAGLWLSAPTGNDAPDAIDRASWPASDPLIAAVGCADPTGAADTNWTLVAGNFFRPVWSSQLNRWVNSIESHRSRNASSVLFFASPMPFASTCNAIACATAVAARRLVARRCSVDIMDVSGARLHELMRRTALHVWDSVTRGPLPLVQPQALYAYIDHATMRDVCTSAGPALMSE